MRARAGSANLFLMKHRQKEATEKDRERRAQALLRKARPNTVPKGMKFVSYRNLTAAERAHGKSLGRRADELLSRKSNKLAVSH